MFETVESNKFPIYVLAQTEQKKLDEPVSADAIKYYTVESISSLLLIYSQLIVSVNKVIIGNFDKNFEARARSKIQIKQIYLSYVGVNFKLFATILFNPKNKHL